MSLNKLWKLQFNMSLTLTVTVKLFIWVHLNDLTLLWFNTTSNMLKKVSFLWPLPHLMSSVLTAWGQHVSSRTSTICLNTDTALPELPPVIQRPGCLNKHWPVHLSATCHRYVKSRKSSFLPVCSFVCWCLVCVKLPIFVTLYRYSLIIACAFTHPSFSWL